MRKFFWVFFFLIYYTSYSQEQSSSYIYKDFLMTELSFGRTNPANTGFPKTKLQKSIVFSIGKLNLYNQLQWAKQLNYPSTGVSIGFSDLGNKEKIGFAIYLMPFSEFSLFSISNKNLNLLLSIGGSYVNKIFDVIENPNNKAISTHFTWAFKSAIHYPIYKSEYTETDLGLTYFHLSNGHTKLPNQGLNTFSLSLSSKFRYNKITPKDYKIPQKLNPSNNRFIDIRTGIGQNVLTNEFNKTKSVYSFAIDYGKIINRSFKLSLGFYYRFYEHYYDYINNNEALIEDYFPEFANNPYGYATNFGISSGIELLLGHIGIEFRLGLNIYKPAYTIDRLLNSGYTYLSTDENDEPILLSSQGKLDWYYEFKKTISTRLGMNFYLVNTSKNPKHNLYLGTHINANLGSADFSELSLGYIYLLPNKNK